MRLSPTVPLQYRVTRFVHYKTTRNINMESIKKHSVACCCIPPIAAKDYVPKGDYTKIDGLKTCK